jgi:hypothetical protein
MKIEIDYYRNKVGGEEIPCGAKAEYEGQSFYSTGKTWQEAMQNVVRQIETYRNIKVPPREIVDLEEPEITPQEFQQTMEDLHDNLQEYLKKQEAK